jgi:hypothetical protein
MTFSQEIAMPSFTSSLLWRCWRRCIQRPWQGLQLGLFARTIEASEREIELIQAERSRQIELIHRRAEESLQELDARVAQAREILEFRIGFYAHKSETIRAELLDDQVVTRRRNRARGLPAGVRYV